MEEGGGIWGWNQVRDATARNVILETREVEIWPRTLCALVLWQSSLDELGGWGGLCVAAGGATWSGFLTPWLAVVCFLVANLCLVSGAVESSRSNRVAKSRMAGSFNSSDMIWQKCELLRHLGTWPPCNL